MITEPVRLTAMSMSSIVCDAWNGANSTVDFSLPLADGVRSALGRWVKSFVSVMLPTRSIASSQKYFVSLMLAVLHTCGAPLDCAPLMLQQNQHARSPHVMSASLPCYYQFLQDG